MQSQTSFVLQSGLSIRVPNGLFNAGSIGIAYTIGGTAPSTLTITVSGFKSASGESPILDSYAGAVNTQRTINLTDTYDDFLVAANWTGGDPTTSVGAILTSASGFGPTFSTSSLPTVHTV